jgi:hypothetical protein
VGAAFRGQDDDVERSEVIFLITPTIVQDEKLYAIGDENLASIDALRVGARAGLLPWSQEKVTANYNQKAQEAYNNGDSDLALHYINKSLGLAPHQTEIIRLREKITGERAKAHERSVMERAFRKEMGPAIKATPAAEPAASTWNNQSKPSPTSSSSAPKATQSPSPAASEMTQEEPFWTDASESSANPK